MEMTEWITRLRIFFKCSAETAKSIYYSYLKDDRLDRLEELITNIATE